MCRRFELANLFPDLLVYIPQGRRRADPLADGKGEALSGQAVEGDESRASSVHGS